MVLHYTTTAVTHIVKASKCKCACFHPPPAGFPVHVRERVGEDLLSTSPGGVSCGCLEVKSDPDVSVLLKRAKEELVDRHDSHTENFLRVVLMITVHHHSHLTFFSEACL